MATEYSINLNVKYKPLELIDIRRIADNCRKEWFNQTLTRVNDCVVRIGILHGEFHLHKHDDEDEFFYVVEGNLLLDLENRTVEIGPNQGFMVPKGVLHRTRAPEKVVVLMIEGAGVNPIGN